jgi:hypothetical protein
MKSSWASTSALLLHLFQSINESSSGTCFAAFRKNSFACYPLPSVAFIFMISLILFRLFGRLHPVLNGQMPSYHVVRRQGVSYSSHPGSVMWVVTGQIGGDGDSRSWQSPESLLVNLSILMATYTSIVVGLSLQIVDCCGVGALMGLKSP